MRTAAGTGCSRVMYCTCVSIVHRMYLHVHFNQSSMFGSSIWRPGSGSTHMRGGRHCTFCLSESHQHRGLGCVTERTWHSCRAAGRGALREGHAMCASATLRHYYRTACIVNIRWHARGTVLLAAEPTCYLMNWQLNLVAAPMCFYRYISQCLEPCPSTN